MGRRSPTEPTHDKAAGDATKSVQPTPMDRFRALARKLTKVPRGEFDEVRKRDDARRERRKP
jgi:hypothetical protein